MFFVHLNTKIHHTNSKLQVNMKKIIFIMLLGLVCNTINAQIVTKQELEGKHSANPVFPPLKVLPSFA